MARSKSKPSAKKATTTKPTGQDEFEVVGVIPGLVNSPVYGLVDLRNIDPVLAKILAEDEDFRYLEKR